MRAPALAFVLLLTACTGHTTEPCYDITVTVTLPDSLARADTVEIRPDSVTYADCR